MEVLGIGPLELMFVILIALIIIGPKDMSKTARSAGRYLNRMYRSETWRTLTQASQTLQALPNRLAREAQLEELEALRKDLNDTGSTAKPGMGDNPALQPWVTPYDTPGQFNTIAPPQPAEPAVTNAKPSKAMEPPSSKKSAPAKPSKAAAKPPVTKAKKSKATKSTSTTHAAAAKPSKAAAKSPSTAKKSRSSSSKAQGGPGKTQPQTASKSSSSAQSGSSRSKPAQPSSR